MAEEIPKRCSISTLRGHLQTIVCMLNVIVTLLPDPPPPLLLTSHFVNLLKISNYVPKARAKYSSLLTKCIANMLELHLFFASFPFCCIRMKLLTSRPRPPHPLSVTMTLSVQIIVWRCPLNKPVDRFIPTVALHFSIYGYMYIIILCLSITR